MFYEVWIWDKMFYCTVSLSVLYLQEGPPSYPPPLLCVHVEFDSLKVCCFSAEVQIDPSFVSGAQKKEKKLQRE